MSLDAKSEFSLSGHDGEAIDSRLTSLSLSVGARKVFDIRMVALSAGLRIGGIYFDQRYETDRTAPPRQRLHPFLDTVARADFQLPWGWFVGAEGALRASYLREKTALFEEEDRPKVQGLANIGVGTLW